MQELKSWLVQHGLTIIYGQQYDQYMDQSKSIKQKSTVIIMREKSGFKITFLESILLI